MILMECKIIQRSNFVVVEAGQEDASSLVFDNSSYRTGGDRQCRRGCNVFWFLGLIIIMQAWGL